MLVSEFEGEVAEPNWQVEQISCSSEQLWHLYSQAVISLYVVAPLPVPSAFPCDVSFSVEK